MRSLALIALAAAATAAPPLASVQTHAQIDVPRGKPQERVLSPLSIVARHGVEALRRGLFRDGLVGGGSAPRTIVLDPAGPGPSPA
jgi:hypothetical protein